MAHNADALLQSEHRYRQITRERGLLDVGMQRIDVRVNLLQSIATQATLVAGFGFAALQPDVLDALILGGQNVEDASLIDRCFKGVFVICAAISFAASIWVIYMCLYAGYQAQLSALQGRTGKAVDASLQLLIRTQEHISQCFTTALVFFSVVTTLLALTHLHLWFSVPAVLVFGYFANSGIAFRREMDKGFASVGHGDAELSSASAAAASGALSPMRTPPRPPPAEPRGAPAAASLGLREPLLPRSEQDAEVGGLEPRPTDLRADDVGLGSSALESSTLVYSSQSGELGGAAAVACSGWLYKSPSRLGPPPAASSSATPSSGGGEKQRRLSAALMSLVPGQSAGAPTPQDRRFFVLQGHELRWYNTEDEATLQRKALTAIDMRAYGCATVASGAPLTFALVPLPQPPLGIAAAKKAWYVRAADADAYDTWLGALGSVVGGEVEGA